MPILSAKSDSEADRPPRFADPVETGVTLALTTLAVIVSMVPRDRAVPAAVAVVALAFLAWHRRLAAAAAFGLILVVSLALGLAGVGPQQIVFALAFAIFAAVVARTPWLRRATASLRPGVLDTTLVALGIAFAVVSGVALVVWYAAMRPDLADLVGRFVPMWPVWALAPAAIAFAMVNAALEEAVYRGVVLEALDVALGAGATAVVLQAAAFAALHFREGFPRGWIGVALTFVYGVVLGTLRRRSGGLLVPWVTHVLTDLVIVWIVVSLVR